MTITAGLFKLDMTDYHAVLGCSLAANPKEVRKRYLKIARQLHPDSLREASAEQKQLASELLSKQVNPAYEALGNEKKAAEYHALLKLKQKVLVAQPEAIAPQSEAAKLLLTARNYDDAYAEALPKMASSQFDDLTQIESVTGNLSELNAVYLIRQAPAKTDAAPASRATAASAQTANPAPAAKPKSSSQPEIIERYFSRAEEFESQKDYARAILELREVTAAHPKSAACHGYLSSLYLQSGQATLAKIHAKQALAFDPSNRLAKDVQEKLARKVPAGASSATRAPKSNSAAGGEKSGGSLLSGLFGGKKR